MAAPCPNFPRSMTDGGSSAERGGTCREGFYALPPRHRTSALVGSINAALGTLSDGDTLERDSAIDLLCSLPARTAEEIILVRQAAEGMQDQRTRKACASSLQYASPTDEQAWQELEKGRGSQAQEVREAVAEAMKRRKKG